MKCKNNDVRRTDVGPPLDPFMITGSVLLKLFGLSLPLGSRELAS